MAEPQHVPVLLEASLEYLNVRPGGVVVDATLGLGGHSAAIARRLGPTGKLIAFDRDEADAIMGRKTHEIESILGYIGRAAMIHRDDMVLRGE